MYTYICKTILIHIYSVYIYTLDILYTVYLLHFVYRECIDYIHYIYILLVYTHD